MFVSYLDFIYPANAHFFLLFLLSSYECLSCFFFEISFDDCKITWVDCNYEQYVLQTVRRIEQKTMHFDIQEPFCVWDFKMRSEFNVIFMLSPILVHDISEVPFSRRQIKIQIITPWQAMKRLIYVRVLLNINALIFEYISSKILEHLLSFNQIFFLFLILNSTHICPVVLHLIWESFKRITAA